MGKKIVNLYGLLCVLSFVVISVCGFSPWYKQKFVTFGIAGVLKLEVSLLTAHVPGDSVLFCGVIRRFKKQVPRTCSDLKDPKMLQDVASDWCSPVIAGAWPVPCQAFNSAYVMGIIVMLCYALNVLCLLTCFYLLYYYVESKSHKKVYRHWAMYMHAIGTGIFMMSCILYSVFAMGRLNAIGGSGIPGFFESSGGVGISPGFFLVWTGIICQLIALGLHGCMKLKDEETEEQKLYKEMLKEQQQYGAMEAQASSHEPQYTGADAYAQGSYSAPAPMSVMGPAYAQAPVAANMPGLP